MPVICNPVNFDRSANFLEAIVELSTYTNGLGLEMPMVDVPKAPTTNLKFKVANAKYFGLYTNGRNGPKVFVNVPICRKPALEPVRVWAFSGYKTDLTPAGVLAHEFGHFYDDMLNIVRSHRNRVLELWGIEGCVSSYCPIPGEWFAETFRVWFLNPNLLELAKPKTAEFMQELGFFKSHELSWQEVLQHAHPKWHAAAENFIKNGTKQNRLKKRKKTA